MFVTSFNAISKLIGKCFMICCRIRKWNNIYWHTMRLITDFMNSRFYLNAILSSNIANPSRFSLFYFCVVFFNNRKVLFWITFKKSILWSFGNSCCDCLLYSKVTAALLNSLSYVVSQITANRIIQYSPGKKYLAHYELKPTTDSHNIE